MGPNFWQEEICHACKKVKITNRSILPTPAVHFLKGLIPTNINKSLIWTMIKEEKKYHASKL